MFRSFLLFTIILGICILPLLAGDGPESDAGVVKRGRNWSDVLKIFNQHGVVEVETDAAFGFDPESPPSLVHGHLFLIEDGVRLYIEHDTKRGTVEKMKLRYAAPFLERRGNYRWFECRGISFHNDRSYDVAFGPRPKGNSALRRMPK